MNSKRILLEGKHRWLRPDEICEVLQNPDGVQIYEKPEFKPSSGSIFLFDRRLQKHFRNDGYKWKKTKGGRTKEAHEKLKVEGVDTLNCYYAHGEEDQSFQRRIYWMLEENLSHRVLVHYRDVKGEKRKARCGEETETAEGVQHSRKTDEITPNSKMDRFSSSSFSPRNFQHSQPTDRTNLNSAPTLEFGNTHLGAEWDDCTWVSSYNNTFNTGFSGLDCWLRESPHNNTFTTGFSGWDYGPWQSPCNNIFTTGFSEGKSKTTPHATIEKVDKDEKEEGTDINQVWKRPKVTCGEKVQEYNSAIQQGEVIAGNNRAASDVAIDTAITDGAMNDATALSQDDETTRLAAFHVACPTVAATSAIGPTHLNPYTTANVADQAQDLQPPVLQPTGTTGVVVLATTNETASSKSSNLSVVQSEPNSNANQDLAQDIIESQEKETEPTSVRPESGKGKADVQNDFGTGKSHESAEVRDISSRERLEELYGKVTATDPVASSSISTPTIDLQAKKKIMATLQMNFITMAGKVHRADMISGIHSWVDSNCFPPSTGEEIMDKLKQLEQYVPCYSTAYSKYDVGKESTLQVEAMKQHLQPKFELRDRKAREFQDLRKQKMMIKARQAAIHAEIDGITKEIETILAPHQNLLRQLDQFKKNEGILKATLDEGDRLWTAFKNIIHRHFPT